MQRYFPKFIRKYVSKGEGQVTLRKERGAGVGCQRAEQQSIMGINRRQMMKEGEGTAL